VSPEEKLISYNEDGSLDAVRAASDCAKEIRNWIDPNDIQLNEMFKEACVKDE
jgi:hypothetical protein